MLNDMPSLRVRIERFPIKGKFTIARGSKTEAVVVVAEITQGGFVGRGECVPYARYGESVEGVAKLISSLAPEVAGGLDRISLQSRLPAGAARNALDCAFWELEAAREGLRVFELAHLPRPEPRLTAYTLSLDTPEAMAQAAITAQRPLLKLKLGAPGDIERLQAVRAAIPDAALIVDANEGWSADMVEEMMAACAAARVELIEQPLPVGADGVLARLPRPVPVCADESAHDRTGLAALKDRYDAINIKLDKTGGLTEALALAREAEQLGFFFMVGCMISSSLAMAPAMLVAQRARIVDLDGPLLLAQDREPGLRYDGALAYPPEPALWG